MGRTLILLLAGFACGALVVSVIGWLRAGMDREIVGSWLGENNDGELAGVVLHDNGFGEFILPGLKASPPFRWRSGSIIEETASSGALLSWRTTD